jgi:hypothetical protein
VSTESNISKEELIEKIREMLVDMITIDVITAKGNYKIINDQANKILDDEIKKGGRETTMIDNPTQSIQDWVDLVKVLSKPPEVIEILARTHIQLDGDRVDILPSEGMGDYSQQDILNFHQKSVDLATQNRTERFQFVLEILKKLGKKIDDIFPDKISPDNNISENESKK